MSAPIGADVRIGHVCSPDADLECALAPHASVALILLDEAPVHGLSV